MKTVAFLKQPQTAFSLTDLLVVIAVLGVLALTVLARPPSKARQTSCAANLRQIGDALAMYVDENSGWLPPSGPNKTSTPQGLDKLQNPAYGQNSNYRKFLPYYLAAYLSLPPPSAIPSTTNAIVPAFICPAYDRAMPSGSGSGIYNPASDNYQTAFSYSVMYNKTNANHRISFYPFGFNSAVPPESPSSHKLSELSGSGTGSGTIPVLSDFDWQSATSTPPPDLGGLFGVNRADHAAKKPVHGKTRNYLFFDLHVAPVLVGSYTNY